MDSEDHSSFTTKIKIHGGPVIARFDCITLLDKGSHQSFITRNAWEHMVRSGAATITCETQTPSRFWRGFGKSPPLQTATTVRLSVQHLHNDQPTESLAVWAYIVPPKAMKHAVLLRRHSWMQFGEGSYNTAPCDHTRAITAFWVISLHRIKIRLAPMPSSRSFRHHQAVITSFARAIEASRSRATTKSKFLGSQ